MNEERCPCCGRRLIVFQRKRSLYWIAVCVCGFYVQAVEKFELKRKIEEVRRCR
jgi:hypothetical protein